MPRQLQKNFLPLVLFAVVFITVLALCRVPNRGHMPPDSYEDVKVILALTFPEGRFHQAGKGHEAFFFILSDKTDAEVNSLPFFPEGIGSWEGVIYCKKAHPADGDGKDWPSQGLEPFTLRMGDFALYGDQSLLETVAKKNRSCSKR